MNNAYFDLDGIWNKHLSGEKNHFDIEVMALLSRHSIQLRSDDGELKQVTISKPTTAENAFVVGMRYIKSDGTYTEDHFVCRKNDASSLEPVKIERYYKGKLERKFQEYKGMHKEQIQPERSAVYDSRITQVNTVSYFIGEK